VCCLWDWLYCLENFYSSLPFSTFILSTTNKQQQQQQQQQASKKGFSFSTPIMYSNTSLKIYFPFARRLRKKDEASAQEDEQEESSSTHQIQSRAYVENQKDCLPLSLKFSSNLHTHTQTHTHTSTRNPFLHLWLLFLVEQKCPIEKFMNTMNGTREHDSELHVSGPLTVTTTTTSSSM